MQEYTPLLNFLCSIYINSINHIEHNVNEHGKKSQIVKPICHK